MSKLNRITGKLFGETASPTGDDPEIGQFGSALAGTYIGTSDVEQIQNLSAWSNGFIDSVTPTNQYPPLPEMTGFGKVLSYQQNYILQQGIPEWDSTTDYYTNCFCSKNGSIYKSLSDNNVNNDPEGDTANWELLQIGVFNRNIGEIVPSAIPLTDAGLHLLDGALLQYGSYQSFIDYIADLYNSGNYASIFATEAAWQSSVTNYGSCGKFVYNSTNNTVRLPKITGITEGTTDATKVGDLIKQLVKLPKITGSIPVNQNLIGTATSSSALYTTEGIGYVHVTGSTANGCSAIKFDSSRSSSVYSGSGSDTKIQPQAIKVLYYIVVANATKTQIEVDIDEIATDLNNKADTDLVNLSNAGNIKTVHNAMPSTTYIDLTLGATGTSYTAPADGYVVFRSDSRGDSTARYCYFYGSGYMAGGDTNGGSSGTDLIWAANVRKSSSFSIYHNLPAMVSGEIRMFRFYYAVGSESEA